MRITIEVLLPVFAIIMCGYGAARWQLIQRAGINGIMDFVQYFAVPALLFRIVVTNGFADAESIGILLTYYSGSFTIFAVALLAGWLIFGLPLEQRAIMGMGSMFSNTFLLGLPLVLAIYGEEGLVAALPVLAVHSLIMLPVTIVVIEIGRGRQGEGQGFAKTLWTTVRGTLQNPIIMGLVIGIAWSSMGWGLPVPVDTFTETLARSVSPAALFALGASMAGFGLGGRISESITMAVLKLTLHPLVVWTLGRFAFDLDPLPLAVVTLIAAMPAGAQVFVIAHRYQVYLARAASALIISGLASLATLTVLFAILAPG